MRIFLCCQQFMRQHPVPAYKFWETYFKRGIEEAGHEWVEAEEVDWAEGLIYNEGTDLKAWRDRTWNRTISILKKQHSFEPIDIFLSYLFPKQVEPTAVKQIQALGIPCVNFFCDNVREFARVPNEFSCFDLHWVPEFKAIEMYRKAELNYVHAPMPLWIPPNHRVSEHPENYRISFIGSRDVQRETLFAQVLALGIPLEIRGAGWSSGNLGVSRTIAHHKKFWQTIANQWNDISKSGIKAWIRKILSKFQTRIPDSTFAGYIMNKPNDSEYVEITQQSKITLGVNRYPSFRYPLNKPDTYSRLRDLEAPMLGACYLTEWTEGLDQLYEVGEEIETYRTAEETVEKIQELMADCEKRKKLRRQGQKRALADHTVAKSLARISDAVGCAK